MPTPSPQSPAASEPGTAARNDAVTHSSKENTRGPRLPNERDESVDSQTPPDPSHADVRDQAFKDAEKGQPDTDKGPVLDQLYNDRLGRDPGPPRP